MALRRREVRGDDSLELGSKVKTSAIGAAGGAAISMWQMQRVHPKFVAAGAIAGFLFSVAGSSLSNHAHYTSKRIDTT